MPDLEAALSFSCETSPFEVQLARVSVHVDVSNVDDLHPQLREALSSCRQAV